MKTLRMLSVAGFIALAMIAGVSCGGGGGGGGGNGSGNGDSSANVAPPTGASVGSCYAVTAASICVDYTGNYWRDNPGTAKLNCEGQYGNSQAVYYDDPCPVDVPFNSNLIGTCVGNMEQAMEMFIRYFNIGGGGYNDPEFDWNWLKDTCEAVGQVWVWGDAKR